MRTTHGLAGDHQEHARLSGRSGADTGRIRGPGQDSKLVRHTPPSPVSLSFPKFLTGNMVHLFRKPYPPIKSFGDDNSYLTIVPLLPLSRDRQFCFPGLFRFLAFPALEFLDQFLQKFDQPLPLSAVAGAPLLGLGPLMRDLEWEIVREGGKYDGDARLHTDPAHVTRVYLPAPRRLRVVTRMQGVCFGEAETPWLKKIIITAEPHTEPMRARPGCFLSFPASDERVCYSKNRRYPFREKRP